MIGTEGIGVGVRQCVIVDNSQMNGDVGGFGLPWHCQVGIFSYYFITDI